MPDPADWPAINRRRGELIDRVVAGTITAAEKAELTRLEYDADLYVEATTPRPTAVLEDLEARVTKQGRPARPDPTRLEAIRMRNDHRGRFFDGPPAQSETDIDYLLAELATAQRERDALLAAAIYCEASSGGESWSMQIGTEYACGLPSAAYARAAVRKRAGLT